MNLYLAKRFESLDSDIWSMISKIDEMKGYWTAGVNLSPQVLGRLKKSVLATSTGASTRIEGAHLSDEDVERFMRGISMQKFSNRDEQEVKGYYELLQNVFDSWEHIRFSENTIKHFHKELLKYAEKDVLHRGEYKKGENKVHMINAAGESVGTLFDTTPAYLTPKEMLELVDVTVLAFSEGTYHPLLITANFVVEFLNIHPFQDGNGRLSRILTNLLLLKHGYIYVPYVSHEKLVEDNKIEYYLALRKSQKTLKGPNPDIKDWLEFFLNTMLTQSALAIDLLSAENIEVLLSGKQMEVWHYLLEVNEAAPKEIMERTGIVRPTLNQVLTKLQNMKKIERLGQGRATRYRVI